MTLLKDFKSYRHENKHVRALEKRETVLCWLANFHYSTRSVLSRVLGIDPAGQYKFFNHLIAADLIRSFSLPTIREELLILTPNGLEHARGLTELALVYNTDPARIGSAKVKHTLSVQLACLEFTNDWALIKSERHLAFTDRIKLPDALIALPSGPIAIEVELTHKNTMRIFRAFYDSVTNIKAGHYTHVHYIFPNDTIRNVYLRHMQTPNWPLYERNPATHSLRQMTLNGIPRTLNAADPRVQQMFTLTTRTLYV